MNPSLSIYFVILDYFKSPYLIFNTDFSVTNLLTEKRLYFSDENGKTVYTKLKNLDYFVSKDNLLANDFDIGVLEDKKLIFSRKVDFLRFSLLRYASIEINTSCNNRCKYCPVSKFPLKKKIIDDNLFEKISHQLSELKTIRWVSLNHYNEPTLDPKLYSKITLMGKYGLRVRLFTNAKNLQASFFTKEIISNMDLLVINLPTLDRAKYLDYTGSKMPRDLIQNINDIINIGMPIEISVNGETKVSGLEKKNIDNILKLSKNKNCHSYINYTNTRAGLISNSFVNRLDSETEKLTGRLSGCRRFLENLAIGIDGELFICCQDYFKKYKIDNVYNKNIKEIIDSVEYINLKKSILGLSYTNEDFICRSCNEAIYV